MKQLLVFIIILHFQFLILNSHSFAQSERKLIREGNKLYNKDKYEDAEISYRKALDKNAKSYEGSFNLGDAAYKQKKYEDATNQFELLTHQESDKKTVAKSFHNLGNSLLQAKQFEKSIEAYKNALRNNPDDTDTKYNLAYAQTMLKQQQQQQQDQCQNKDKENKEDQQDQENKQDQQEENEQKQDEQKQEEQTEQNEKQQPRPDQISKEDAERLLEALKNEEMDVQEKLKKKKAKATKIKIEKDW
ncbi:MAG: tetratricopeptide repeat protein [Bacteroidota bacterium]